MIKGYCIAGEIENARQVFVKMGSEGFTPNVIVYNTLIIGHVKADLIRGAFRLLEDMCREGLVPNDVTHYLLKIIRAHGLVRACDEC